jgi:sugar lactone lactonase YvrE
LAWPLAAQLGEGPVWIGRERALWFVDIEGRSLHRFDPASGAGKRFPMPGRPSFIAPADDGSLIVGMELQLHRVLDGALAGCIADIGGDPRCRTNDATVDPRGRLWFGTMDLAQQAPIGQVHVFDGDGLRAAGGNCPITNGPAVSPRGDVLYHVDTLGGIVWAFDIATRDTLVGGREFLRIAAEDGFPDGITVDAQACLWVGLWGGWCVRRYSPAGELLLEVPIPCAQVTKLAFGGEALRTAYVTTARTGLDQDALRAQPLAGALFAFDAPAPGLPAQAVALR